MDFIQAIPTIFTLNNMNVLFISVKVNIVDIDYIFPRELCFSLEPRTHIFCSDLTKTQKT